MRARKFTLTAVAVIAAAAVSACAPAAEKPWPNAGAAGTSTAAPASAMEKPVWRNIQAEAPRVSTDSRGGQFGPVLHPGIGITQWQPGNGSEDCTLGPAIIDSGQRGFITAGHCDTAPGGDVVAFADAESQQEVPVGKYTESKNAPATAAYQDSAALLTSAPLADTTRIAGRWAVAGVLTQQGIHKLLPVGSTVCVNAAYAGIKCGEITSLDDGGLLRFTIPTGIGDSGAPVFAVDQLDNAHLLGIVKGGNAATSTATFLADQLDRLDAVALVDSTASTAVKGDTRYSPRVTTS